MRRSALIACGHGRGFRGVELPAKSKVSREQSQLSGKTLNGPLKGHYNLSANVGNLLAVTANT